jgi:hypothetical protein
MNLDKLNVQELSMEEKVNTEGGFFMILTLLTLAVTLLIGYFEQN